MTLISLTLYSETPFFLGSYDTQFHREDAFRTQSLKGVWRYWLRAYVAGALYELGLLKSKSSGPLLAKIDDTSLKLLLDVTQDILGGPDKASSFRIVLDQVNVATVANYPQYPESNLPRVKLLTLGRRPLSYAKRITVNISIEDAPHVSGKLDINIVKIGIGSLLTALTLSGLGKMSRRGLGTFTIRVRDNTRLFRQYLDYQGYLDYNKLPQLINDVLKTLKEYISSVKKVKGVFSREIPPINTITSEKIEYNVEVQGSFIENNKVPIFTVYSIEFSKPLPSVLQDLQNFFYRPGRIKSYYGKLTTEYGHVEDQITQNKDAWYFGLPREQRNTGYLAQVERRASPFIVAVHRRRAFISVFLSQDWPRKIVWRGISSKEISLTRDLLINTHCRVLSYLENYLKKLNYSFEVIYP